MYDFHTLPLACELSLSFLSHECEWICTIVSSQVPDEYACTTKLFHQMVGPVSQQSDSSYKALRLELVDGSPHLALIARSLLAWWASKASFSAHTTSVKKPLMSSRSRPCAD